jgi:hypothetical protein
MTTSRWNKYATVSKIQSWMRRYSLHQKSLQECRLPEIHKKRRSLLKIAESKVVGPCDEESKLDGAE